MRKILFVPVLIAFAILVGCVPFDQKPQLNALQIETMQTRTFDVNKRIAFNAVVTVFQNLGYIVETADYDTGFITAKSPTNTNFFGTTSCTKSTAFVTEKSNGSTRIRINFVENSIFTTQQGQQNVTETPIEDPQSYVNAFNKIRQQIFVSTGMDPIKTTPSKDEPAKKQLNK